MRRPISGTRTRPRPCIGGPQAVVRVSEREPDLSLVAYGGLVLQLIELS